MNVTFVFKESIRQVPSFDEHHGAYITVDGVGGRLLRLGAQNKVELFISGALIELLASPLSERLAAHLDRIVLKDHFVCTGVLTLGQYDMTIEGARAVAELTRSVARTVSRPQLESSPQSPPWQHLEYTLLVMSEKLPIALGLYTQIREGKIEPVKNWDGRPER